MLMGQGRVGPGRLLRHAVTHQDGQDVADGWFLAGRFWQREVRLDLIAVAAAVFVLDDVSGRGQVRDDAVRAALGDTQGGGDVPQPRTRILGNAQQDPWRDWSGSSISPPSRICHLHF